MTTQRDRDDDGRFTVAEFQLEERRAKVVELKVGGYSFREIGKQLGINEGTACRDYRAVIDRTKADADETIDEHRREQLAQLGIAIRVLMPMVEGGSLDAMDRLVKVQKERALLLGTYAPTKVSAEVASVGLDELDELRKAAKANACSSPDPQKRPDESGQSS